MKRFLLILLAAVLVWSMTACGGAVESSSAVSDADIPVSVSSEEPEDAAQTVQEPELEPETAPEPEEAVPTVEEAEEPAETGPSPKDLIGRTFTYVETVEAFGLVINWELTFEDDATATLFEPNDFMGDTTYTCSWELQDGIVTTRILESTGGMPIAEWFDAADGYACQWEIHLEDETVTPLGAESSGLPVSESNADFPNVAYASNSSAQIMDIYLPENPTGSDPVIVVTHGGGFKFGSQTMEIIQPIIAAGTANGYVVASVDYRKSGEATFPAAVADVKAAVRYLRANASEYGIDPDQIMAWGESAGAYLAVMTALTPEVEALNGDVTENLDQSSAVSALVDFYGPVEFYTLDEEFIALGDEASANHTVGSFETDFIGVTDMEADRAATDATWWQTYRDQLPKDFDLHAWIQAGTADTNIPYTQSENLAAQLAEIVGEDHVQFGLIEGAAHEDDAFYTEENLSEVFAFLKKVLN